jgi:hypothetical protein
VLSNVQPENAGVYRLSVTNEYGSILSSGSTLNVTGYGNGGTVTFASPAAVRREPSTRFERAVSDLNRSLEQVTALGEQMDGLLRRVNAVAAEQGGRGMIGRLALEPRTLDTLHALATRLAVITAPVADTSRSILARLKLDSLESGVTAALGGATGTLRRLDTTAMRGTALMDSLQPVIRIVKDSLPPALGRVNSLLDQGSDAAKVAKVALPAALLSGVAAALVGILEMLGAC